MAIVLVKATVLFLGGFLTLAVMRHSSAAMRHLVCLCVLAGSLIVPLAALLPAGAISIRISAVQALANSGFTSPGGGPQLSSMLLGLWIVGSAILVIRLAVSYWRLSRLLESATLIEPSLLAADVEVPLAAGLFNSAVLLPRSAFCWPAAHRDAAVRHERAHIWRRDLQANFIAALACAVYWFHPLVWKLASTMRSEQESACDDLVIDSGFDPAVYAEALLSVARNSTPTPLPGCPMTNQNCVSLRIKRLLNSGRTRGHSQPTPRQAIAVLALMLLGVGGVSSVRADQVYSAGGDVVAPRVLQTVQPDYTEQARSEKISGTVVLSLVVGPDGRAHDVSILQSLDPGLDRNAAMVLEKWLFAPGTLHGEPVAVRATIEVNFKLL